MLVLILALLPARAACLLDSFDVEVRFDRGAALISEERSWTVQTGAVDCAVIPLGGRLLRVRIRHADDTFTRLGEERVFAGDEGPSLHLPELRPGDVLTVREERTLHAASYTWSPGAAERASLAVRAPAFGRGWRADREINAPLTEKGRWLRAGCGARVDCGDDLRVVVSSAEVPPALPVPVPPNAGGAEVRVGVARDGLLVMSSRTGPGQRLPAPGGFVRLGDLLDLDPAGGTDVFAWVSHEGPGGPSRQWLAGDGHQTWEIACRDAAGWLQCGALQRPVEATDDLDTVLEAPFRIWK